MNFIEIWNNCSTWFMNYWYYLVMIVEFILIIFVAFDAFHAYRKHKKTLVLTYETEKKNLENDENKKVTSAIDTYKKTKAIEIENSVKLEAEDMESKALLIRESRFEEVLDAAMKRLGENIDKKIDSFSHTITYQPVSPYKEEKEDLSTKKSSNKKISIYETYSMKELKNIARENNLTGYAKFSRDELIDFLKKYVKVNKNENSKLVDNINKDLSDSSTKEK